MRAIAVGALIGVLVLAVGVTVAAWFAIMVAVVAIVAGAVDYVQSHG